VFLTTLAPCVPSDVAGPAIPIVVVVPAVIGTVVAAEDNDDIVNVDVPCNSNVMVINVADTGFTSGSPHVAVIPMHKNRRCFVSQFLQLMFLTQIPVPEDTHSNYLRHAAKMSVPVSSATGLSTHGTNCLLILH